MTPSLRRAGLVLAACVAPTLPLAEAQAASHREAPITAIDRTADITDWYAFVSPDAPDTVTMILAVDPLLEPGNGPNYFPFDDNLLYQLQRRQRSGRARRHRLPDQVSGPSNGYPRYRSAIIGAGDGINAPPNSPPPIAPGTPLIPPAITALDGPGSEGLGLRQTYTVTHGRRRPGRDDPPERRLERAAVRGPEQRRPAHHAELPGPGRAGDLRARAWGSRVRRHDRRRLLHRPRRGLRLAELSRDPGAHLHRHPRGALGSAGCGGPAFRRWTRWPATTSIPSRCRCRSACSRAAATSRLRRAGTRRSELTARPRDGSSRCASPGSRSRAKDGFVQVQRMGNPLFNELIIGTGLKDLWSRSAAEGRSPVRGFRARPIDRAGGAGRVRRGVRHPHAAAKRPAAARDVCASDRRRAVQAGSDRRSAAAQRRGAPDARSTRPADLACWEATSAGFPNGRRPFDDVTDIVLRVVVGGVLVDGFDVFPNNRLGDGVNIDDYRPATAFPYVGPAQDGRNSRHIDPGEPGCATLAGKAKCPIG